MFPVIKRFLLFLLFFVISYSVLAIDCKLAKSLNHPELANSAEFWNKLTAINSADNRAIEALIKEYAPSALLETKLSVSVAASSTKEAFSIHSKAEKARVKLSKINQQHFDEFIQVLTEKGPQGLYEQPKRWHYEKLKANKSLHTVRLDNSNRVLFTIEDGTVKVVDIGKHITH